MTPEQWHEFVKMWAACRGFEGGIAHWPDVGGLGDQSAWVVDAFSMLSVMNNTMTQREKELRGDKS